MRRRMTPYFVALKCDVKTLSRNDSDHWEASSVIGPGEDGDDCYIPKSPPGLGLSYAEKGDAASEDDDEEGEEDDFGQNDSSEDDCEWPHSDTEHNKDGPSRVGR